MIGFPFPLSMTQPEPIKVDPVKLANVVDLVRSIACTDLRCKNATATGRRTCTRCEALLLLATLHAP